MNAHIRRMIFSLSIALVLLLNAPLVAFAAQNKEEKKEEKRAESAKDEKAKPASTAKDDKSKPTKQEREYQKIKQFSIERYNKNADFRDEVEESYRQKQREHSEYAFRINTSDAASTLRIRDGDRLKGQSGDWAQTDALYDNPLAQDYVNRVGQSLVPPESQRLYAFKITLNPIPEARSLSTGTIYVSSGLLAQIDNEAQLAYVLGHEVAHCEREHWREDTLVQLGLEAYNEKQQQKRAIIGTIARVGAGVMTGGMLDAGNMLGVTAGLYAQLAVPTLVKMAVPNAVVSWEKSQEDEADQHALRYMLNRSYDPREVPKLYMALDSATKRDRRAGLGFMANVARIAERIDHFTSITGPLGLGGSTQTQLMVGAINLNMQRQIDAVMASAQQTAEKPADTGKTINLERDAAGRATAAERALATNEMSAEIKQKLDAGQLIGSTSEFLTVMAELKRDNGVRALYYDMFQMARRNLEESLQIRSNDPLAHFYYGKVLKLTARTTTEKQRALNSFVSAIQYDRRQVLPEARLHRALALIENKDPQQTREIVNYLKEYVTLYQREHAGQLPPNMDVIYDYMQEAGEMTWSAPPAINVSTKSIDPIGVSSSTAAAARPASAESSPATAQPSQPTPAPGNKTQKSGARRP